MEPYQKGELIIRPATEKDVPTILKFILELAEFEGAADQVHSTEEGLHKVIFKLRRAEALICEMEGLPVGFAIWAYSFSTFTGKQTLYIDDLYVRQPYRGRGIGSKIFSWLAGVADENDCARMDWYCMETNQSGKEYYRKIGAEEINWFKVYRFNREKIDACREALQ